MKLLTATAAVAALGADFHFTTKAVAPDAVAERHASRASTSSAAATRCSPRRSASRPTSATRDTAGLPTQRRSRRSPTGSWRPGVRRIPGGVARRRRPLRPRPLPAASGRRPVRTDIGPIGALTVNDGSRRAGRHRRRGRPIPRSTPRPSSAGCSRRAASPSARPAGPSTRPTARRGSPPLDSPPLPDGPRGAPERVRQPERGDAARASSASTRARARPRRGVAGDPRRAHAAARRPRPARASSTAPASPTTTGCTCATLLVGARRSTRSRGSRRSPTAWRSRAGAARSPRASAAPRSRTTCGRRPARSPASPGSPGYVRSDRPLTFALLLGGGFSQTAGYALREAMATDIAGVPGGHRRRRRSSPAPIAADCRARACRSAEGAC